MYMRCIRQPRARFVLAIMAALCAGVALFTPEGLATLASLTERLRAVPGVRSDEVLSIATALDVTLSAGAVRLTRFLDHPPGSAAEADSLRRRLDDDGTYAGLLYGRDGRSALILLPLVPEVPRAATTQRVRTELDRLDGSTPVLRRGVALEVSVQVGCRHGRHRAELLDDVGHGRSCLGLRREHRGDQRIELR